MGKLVPAWIASPPLPQGPSSQQRERFPRLSHSQIRKAQPLLRELKPCPASRVKLRESGADLTGGRIGQAYQPSSPFLLISRRNHGQSSVHFDDVIIVTTEYDRPIPPLAKDQFQKQIRSKKNKN